MVFCFEMSYSQNTREAHLVLVIDEQLVIGSVANAKIMNGMTSVEASYYPGRLVFGMQDFDNLISENNDSLTLAFDYYENGKGRQLLYNYKLHLSNNG